MTPGLIGRADRGPAGATPGPVGRADQSGASPGVKHTAQQ
jgi:hypothetical protein